MASSDKAAGGPERKRALTTRQTVLLALMFAMAMGLHAVEGLVSYVSPMPGIRLGLANIVILICFSFFREGQVFLVTLLRLLLTGEGYAVCTAENGKEALVLASAEVDLYLLDVNMPELSGFMAGSEIRKQFNAPIIFLTAYSGESDKVMGFSAGADDYIVKPFSNMELLMRVKAILRRSARGTAPAQEEKKSHIPFGDLILDLECQSVLRQGEVIVLTYTEFKILELLVTHKKKIYSLENIYQSIWEEDAVGDSAIMVHIKNIRKKLEDDSRNPRYIKTAWGRGYYVDQ